MFSLVLYTCYLKFYFFIRGLQTFLTVDLFKSFSIVYLFSTILLFPNFNKTIIKILMEFLDGLLFISYMFNIIIYNQMHFNDTFIKFLNFPLSMGLIQLMIPGKIKHTVFQINELSNITKFLWNSISKSLCFAWN